MNVFADAPVLPEERLVIWRALFPLFRGAAWLLAPWRIEGAERIPTTGGYILVSNHINWKDPPWLEFALGHAIRFMAKHELFEVPVIGFALRAIGAFPVRRGEADRGALQMALRVLEAGQPVGFFPEGHRSESGALIRGHPGVALIARRSDGNQTRAARPFLAQGHRLPHRGAVPRERARCRRQRRAGASRRDHAPRRRGAAAGHAGCLRLGRSYT